MRISDWSSDVCSSDLKLPRYRERRQMLADAGASAALVISNGAVPWPALRESLGGKYVLLASAKPGAPGSGFLPGAAAEAQLHAAGKDGAAAHWDSTHPQQKGAALPGNGD